MSASILPAPALEQIKSTTGPRKAAFAERPEPVIKSKKTRKQRVEAAFKIVLQPRGAREFAGREYTWLCPSMRMTTFSEVCYDKTEMPRYALSNERILTDPRMTALQESSPVKARFWAKI